MPKSKVRKKAAYTPPSDVLPSAATRARAKSPSPTWYAVVMVALMVTGLIYISLYYISGDVIPFMTSLGSWNFLIGFGLMVAGLIMSMRWR
ncbi:MAG: cell division protein CrgA [Geodermatophilaceae bacterium]|nr:cell division protein CrgA [Geodermatophilaceae bacterium]